MKAKMLLILGVVLMSARLISAQVNCASYLNLDPKTGLADPGVSQGPLACQYPFSSIAIAQAYFGGNRSQFTPSQITAIVTAITDQSIPQAAPINSAIAFQLAQLPIPSAAAGTVTLTLPGSDVGSPFNNLGPILTDRPDTYPKHRYFLGFAYQHFNFDQIDSLPFSALNFAVAVPNIQVPTAPDAVCGNTTNSPNCGTLYAGLLSNISIQMDQYIGLLTYGLTRSTDVTIAVPVNSVSVNTLSQQYSAYLYVPAVQGSQNAQYIILAQPDPNVQTPLKTSGSASGVGDVSVNVKQMLFGQEGSAGRYAGAMGVQLRFPTGDANNYLGSGAYGATVYGLVEYRGTYKHHGIAPHVKVGYQWNGESQIMDISSPTHLQLPSGLDYAFGSDFEIKRTFSIAVDGVGHQYVNAPSLTAGSLPLPTVTNSGVPSSLSASITGNNTYTTFNFSGGFKWMMPKTKEHLLLYANVMVPINNVGLHSDPVPMVGIAFKK